MDDVQQEQLNQGPKYQPAKKVISLPFSPYVISQSIKKDDRIQKPEQIPQRDVSTFFPTSLKKAASTNIQQRQKKSQSWGEEENKKTEYTGEVDENGDPPLLQDLGIEVETIKAHIINVLSLRSGDAGEADMSGPILIGLLLGTLLLLSGKVHFGDIYAMFVLGNLLLYLLFNFMVQQNTLPLYAVMSAVGYALLPMLLLGLLNVFLELNNTFGILIGLFLAAWSSLAATNLIQTLFKQSHSTRRILITYPLFLFYVSFCLIVIF